jgi:hypothetical protein
MGQRNKKHEYLEFGEFNPLNFYDFRQREQRRRICYSCCCLPRVREKDESERKMRVWMKKKGGGFASCCCCFCVREKDECVDEKESEVCEK